MVILWIVRILVLILMLYGGAYMFDFSFFDGEGTREWKEERAERQNRKAEKNKNP